MRAAGSTVLLTCMLLCSPCRGQTMFERMPDKNAGQPEIAIGSVDLTQRASQAAVANAVEGYTRLDVTVTDKSGRPVTGLGARDFTLLDNGQAPKLVSFHAFDEGAARPDPPTEVILVIDAVNLSPQQVTTADREVDKFLRANGGHLAHPTVIYRLTGWGLTRSEWPTSDGSVVAAEVARGKEPQVVWQRAVRTIEPQLTADYARGRNAFSLAALGSMAIEERRKPGRKVMLWIGPGWPVKAGGEGTFDEIVEMSTRLREARITLSTVTAWAYPEMEFSYENFLRGVRDEKEASPFDMQLEVLAIKSGGRVVEPSFDLAGAIQKAIDGADDFYTLTFDPPRTNTVDEYHELKVVVDRPDVIVRTEMAYYDEPSICDQPPALERVTLTQLKGVLADDHGRHDEEVARQLNGFELTERMNSGELARWSEQMPGAKSRAALVVLSDRSVFLKPPADTVVQGPAPDIATQKEMMARTVDYLARVISKLPDFFATRTTVRYEEPMQGNDETWKTVVGDQTLHKAETSTVTMHIRNGKEVAESERERAKRGSGRERSLVTEGTFGPILSTVIVGAAAQHSHIEWSRWEEGPQGREAVFRYTVSEGTPLFEAGFCCLADPDGTIPFRQRAGFHGEIATDAESGAILRIAVQADLKPRLPLAQSGVVVEYGPVTIGGKSYICPTRSVSISRSRTVRVLHEWNESFGVYGPFETMVNDVTFSDYHVFRSTSRILMGAEAAP